MVLKSTPKRSCMRSSSPCSCCRTALVVGDTLQRRENMAGPDRSNSTFAIIKHNQSNVLLGGARGLQQPPRPHILEDVGPPNLLQYNRLPIARARRALGEL